MKHVSLNLWPLPYHLIEMLIDQPESTIEQTLSRYLPQPLTCVEGAFPPMRVLHRTIDNLADSVDELWALPYLIIQQDHIVGCCGFKCQPENRRVEIGYNVSPERQGQGIATQALGLMIQLAFDSQQVDSIIALIDPENHASIHVVKKNNFKYQQVIKLDHDLLQSWVLDQKQDN